MCTHSSAATPSADPAHGTVGPAGATSFLTSAGLPPSLSPPAPPLLLPAAAPVAQSPGEMALAAAVMPREDPATLRTTPTVTTMEEAQNAMQVLEKDLQAMKMSPRRGSEAPRSSKSTSIGSIGTEPAAASNHVPGHAQAGTQSTTNGTETLQVQSSRLHDKPRYHPDGMREIRAMAMAALPVPPMPIMVCREMEDESSFIEADMACCSSHDLIAHLMNIACTVATEAQNARREGLQWQAQTELFEQIDAYAAADKERKVSALLAAAGVSLPPVQWTYGLFADFTRKYVRSFMPDPTKAQDIRFLTMHDIDRTHRVHTKALQFQKAQDILYAGDSFKERFGITRSYDVMSYAELIQVSMARIMDATP